MHGVVDRIEDGVAIILVPERGEEFHLKEEQLPEGSAEGTWFSLSVNGGEFTILAIDRKKTAEQKSNVASLQGNLKLRKRSSKFKRK